VQSVRLHREALAHGQLKTEVERAAKVQAQEVLKDERATATSEAAHAGNTQENSDAFTTTQPARDADVRADLERADRLRLDAERRAATYRAQAQASAAACSDLADRHAALDAHVVRGTAVVAGLRGDLARRDAEVALLRRQIEVDRELLQPQ
jgi:hypothetical protein